MVFTPHGIYPPRSFGNALLKLVFDRTFGRSLLKHSTKIIALSEHNVELLSQLGAELEKITIVPNGVSTEEYLSSARSASIRREVGSDGPLLLYVGRIDWNKQIESVVKSMPLIKKDFPKAKFVVVGPDYADYSAELLRLARKLAVEDSLVIAGRVSGQRLREYYSNADAFILPSSYEGFGLSMLEAMISKIPVIVSPIGGPGDILKNRVHAWFLRNTTPEEISNAVRTVLTNDQLKRDLIKNSFELVSSKYTWKSVVDKLESIYRQVICERGQAY
jgi:glycogen(starch) synthase